jgi:multidrug resistance protein, MATE family
MPYVATFQIADGLAQANGGCLRGMGRQHLGATVNLIAYYALALPVGIHLAFNGWGLAGLWAGNAGGIFVYFRRSDVALFIVGFFEWGLVWVTNWQKQVKIAYARCSLTFLSYF